MSAGRERGWQLLKEPVTPGRGSDALRLLAVAVLTGSLLAACVPVPFPHRSINAPRFSGRVLRGVTHQPVMGATVVLGGLPDSAAQTDAAGRFTTRFSYSVHAVGLYGYDEGLTLQFPPSRHPDGRLMVFCPGYQPAEVVVNCGGYPRWTSEEHTPTQILPDVRLQALRGGFDRPPTRSVVPR